MMYAPGQNQLWDRPERRWQDRSASTCMEYVQKRSHISLITATPSGLFDCQNKTALQKDSSSSLVISISHGEVQVQLMESPKGSHKRFIRLFYVRHNIYSLVFHAEHSNWILLYVNWQNDNLSASIRWDINDRFLIAPIVFDAILSHRCRPASDMAPRLTLSLHFVLRLLIRNSDIEQ